MKLQQIEFANQFNDSGNTLGIYDRRVISSIKDQICINSYNYILFY